MASWLWPDRVIGKRESRQLREEHNATNNLLHEALDQLETLADAAFKRDTSMGDPALTMQRRAELWEAYEAASNFIKKARGA